MRFGAASPAPAPVFEPAGGSIRNSIGKIARVLEGTRTTAKPGAGKGHRLGQGNAFARQDKSGRIGETGRTTGERPASDREDRPTGSIGPGALGSGVGQAASEPAGSRQGHAAAPTPRAGVSVSVPALCGNLSGEKSMTAPFGRARPRGISRGPHELRPDTWQATRERAGYERPPKLGFHRHRITGAHGALSVPDHEDRGHRHHSGSARKTDANCGSCTFFNASRSRTARTS